MTDSTLTYNTGEFSLPLNPDDYQLNSVAHNYVDVSQPISVNLEDVTAVDLQLAPLSDCASDSAPVLDPVVLAQQAVAVYDELESRLLVRDVIVGDKAYYLELQDLGGYQFQVDKVIELPNVTHNPSASYDLNALTAELPSVYFDERVYKMTLKNNNGVFTVQTIQ